MWDLINTMKCLYNFIVLWNVYIILSYFLLLPIYPSPISPVIRHLLSYIDTPLVLRVLPNAPATDEPVFFGTLLHNFAGIFLGNVWFWWNAGKTECCFGRRGKSGLDVKIVLWVYWIEVSNPATDSKLTLHMFYSFNR